MSPLLLDRCLLSYIKNAHHKCLFMHAHFEKRFAYVSLPTSLPLDILYHSVVAIPMTLCICFISTCILLLFLVMELFLYLSLFISACLCICLSVCLIPSVFEGICLSGCHYLYYYFNIVYASK